ncbi:MAG TPA: cyclic nucleotide-binding domain-containing protein [Acidimicrobiia bacterium]|nr:cyclic nucleotide-binding domain-containing protein [Acidimicrobiia bacterium]
MGVELLKQTGLFSSCTDKELKNVMVTAKEREFDTGEVIIREGDPGLGFYLLLEGTAEVRKAGKAVAELEPGDYFGEMALLLEDTPRTADVVATSKTRCLVITQWDLRALISTHPDIGMKIMNELAIRLSGTEKALAD